MVSTHYIIWPFSFWIWRRRCLKFAWFWPFGALPLGPHGGHTYYLNNFESPTPKDDFCQVWVKSNYAFSRRRWKCKKFMDDGRKRTAIAHFKSLRLRWATCNNPLRSITILEILPLRRPSFSKFLYLQAVSSPPTAGLLRPARARSIRPALRGYSRLECQTHPTNQLRRPPISRASPLQRPTFSRSRPLQRPAFSRSSCSRAHFSLRRGTCTYQNVGRVSPPPPSREQDKLPILGIIGCHWQLQKTSPFPGFLWKSSQDYAPKIPPYPK